MEGGAGVEEDSASAGAAATLEGSAGAAGTADGEPAVGRLGATTAAGACAEGSAVGGKGNGRRRVEDAPAAIDSGSVWYGAVSLPVVPVAECVILLVSLSGRFNLCCLEVLMINSMIRVLTLGLVYNFECASDYGDVLLMF